MAKINARGARLLHEFTTERTVSFEDSAPTLYREKWRIRSDGAILTRIIWSESEARAQYAYYGDKNHPNRLKHNSGYRIWRKFGPKAPESEWVDRLRNLLTGKLHATIIEEG